MEKCLFGPFSQKLTKISALFATSGQIKKV